MASVTRPISVCRSLPALITPGKSAELTYSGADFPETERGKPFPCFKTTRVESLDAAFILTRKNASVKQKTDVSMNLRYFIIAVYKKILRIGSHLLPSALACLQQAG
jgi:hypothetical protein